jgi:hypothetical protein
MSLFATPEEHAANPPTTWVAVKAGPRWWNLRTSSGAVLDTYPTKKAAEAARTDSFYATLYDRETRWYAGEPVAGWKPYNAPKKEG